MSSVERLLNYSKLPSEPPAILPEDKNLKNWPSKGAMEFKNVKFKYREDLPLTLKSINLKINQGEKIGCCGRTGAGKSSTI